MKNKINELIINSIYNNIKFNHKKLFESYQFKTKNQKYELKFILEACIHFIKISSSYKNFVYKDLKSSSFYKNFMKLNKFNIFELTYKQLLNKYLKKNKNKIKYVFTDTSVFNNKYNVDKVAINKYYKNKKVMKLSLITNEKGIPLNVDLYKGNLNDITIFNDQLMKLNKNSYEKNNTIFMADKGYDSIKLRNKLTEYFDQSIIPFNKRNTKDINKIKILTNNEKELYKKRIKIENTFSKIKRYRRLNLVYEKKSINFISLIYLSLIEIIFNEK